MYRKLLALAAAPAVVIGIGLMTAGAANAAPAAPAIHATSFAPLGTKTSQFLAGHVGGGSDRLTQLRQYWGPLPDYTGWTQNCVNAHGGTVANPNIACESQVAIGGLLVQNSGGGVGTGQAMVWDAAPVGENPSTVCPDGQFTLEGGTGFVNVGPGGVLGTIPVTNLKPLDEFGGPQCFSPGQTEFGKVVISRTAHETYYENGPSEAQEQLSNAPIHNFFDGMFWYGQGVTVTTGANAAFLVTGTLADFTNQGLSETQTSGPDKRINLSSLPYYNVNSTLTGGPPSVSNPLTMTSLGFGVSASTSEIAP